MVQYKIIILAPIFIIILLVTFKAIRTAFSLEPAGAFVLSICVSLLSVIGMSRCLHGSLEAILLPYTAMGISILILLLLMFLGKFIGRSTERISGIHHRERKTESRTTSKHNRNIRKP